MQMGFHSLPCPPSPKRKQSVLCPFLWIRDTAGPMDTGGSKGSLLLEKHPPLQVAGVSDPSFPAGNCVKSGGLIVTLEVPGELDLPGSCD